MATDWCIDQHPPFDLRWQLSGAQPPVVAADSVVVVGHELPVTNDRCLACRVWTARASGAKWVGQPRTQRPLRPADESGPPRTVIQGGPVIQDPRQRDEKPCSDKHRNLQG